MKSGTLYLIAVLGLLIFPHAIHGQQNHNQQPEKYVDEKSRKEIDEIIASSARYLYNDPEKTVEQTQRAAALSKAAGYLKGEAYALQRCGEAFNKLTQYASAQTTLEASQKIFTQINDISGMATGYYLLGESYERRSNSDTALLFFNKALALGTQAKNKETVAWAHYWVATHYILAGDFSKAAKRLEETENLALATHNKTIIAMFYEARGSVYLSVTKLDEATAYINKALQLHHELGYKSRIARCYYLIGTIHIDKSDYDSALYYHLQSMQLLEDSPAKNTRAAVASGIGTIYYRRGDHTNALQYYKRSLESWGEIGDTRGVIDEMSNVASVYLTLGKYDSALTVYRKGIAMANKVDTKDIYGKLYINTSICHLALKRYDSTLHYAKLALSFAEDTGDQIQIIDACKVIGVTHFELKKPDEGIRFFNRAITLSKESNLKGQLKELYSMLSEVFAETQNFRQALHYHQLFDSVHNLVVSERKNKDIAEIEAKYQTEKKDKVLAQNDLMINAQNLSLARNQVFIAVLALSVILLIAIGIILRMKYKKRQMALKMEYDRKQLKIEQQLELSHLKSEVFTNISHEFRTPLTLFLAPLEQMMKETPSEQQRQRYEMMHRNANQLLDMVNQMLELSKIESGHEKLQVGKHDIVNFIREVIQYFIPLKEKHGITITLLNELENPYVYFDKHKFEKVLYNLISNAFKYSDKGGSIIITVSTKAGSDTFDFPEGFIEIAVKDSGKGIAREHVPYIFNRFYQVDSSQANGSGIGLALAKEIVEMHAGKIEAKSLSGVGTEFIVSLPLGKGHFHEEELHESLRHIAPADRNKTLVNVDWPDTNGHAAVISEDKPTVLVVEDNTEVNQYISTLFSESYNVLHASDGLKGFDLGVQHSPDLIICDVMMPGMDGYALTHKFKNDLATSHIPVILLTAKAEQQHKMEGLEAGADDYLTKPFHVEELLTRSANLVAQRKKLRALFSKAPLAKSTACVPTDRDQKILSKATEVVLSYIDDPEFGVEKLCKEIGMSYPALHKKLKALTGQHVTKFIRCIRLKKAVELIESEAGSMSDIAAWVGFNNRQFFIRSFREQYGMTPTEYKASIKRVMEL